MNTLYRREHFYIGGEWRAPAQLNRLPVFSPATGEQIGAIPKACAQDIDAAVMAASRALSSPDWATVSAAERGKMLVRMAEYLSQHAEAYCEVSADESGAPLAKLLAGKMAASAIVGYFASLLERYPFLDKRQTASGAEAWVKREPVGVVGSIIPFNGSILGTVSKVAPAIAAGCTVVVKPALDTPLQTYAVAEAVQAADIPPGVVNIVPAGRAEGQHLVTHPAIDKIAFTGSTTAGKAIAQVCAGQLKRYTLELGGKAPTIVLDDVPISETATKIAQGAFYNSGQACIAMSRILVARSRHDEFVNALCAQIQQMTLGDPRDEDTVLGPLINQQQLERVKRFVELGSQEGGKIVCGGKQPAHLQRGWYYEPTVFTGMTNRMRLAREEVFGPVVVIIPFDSDAEAVAMANDSPFGLSGSVYTADVERGLALAQEIRVGVFGVNNFTLDFGLPFGGMKDSGVGREFGPEGLTEYTECKVITFPAA